MELIEVEAVEDRARPEGGHAVLLLRGIDGVPASTRFEIRIVDPEGLDDNARTFLEGPHAPEAVTATDDGIALSIGPAIAVHPALVPGTAVEICLPDASLRGEFLWPSITPLARPKRRNIMTRRLGPEIPVRDRSSEMPANQPSAAVETGGYDTAARPESREEPATPLAPQTTSLPSTPPRRSIVVSSARPRFTEQVTSERTPASSLDEPLAEAGSSYDPVPTFEDDSNDRAIPTAMPLELDVDAKQASHQQADEAPAITIKPPVETPAIAAATAPDTEHSPTPVPKNLAPTVQSQTVEAPAPRPSPAPRSKPGLSVGSAVPMAIALMLGGQIVALRALDYRLEKRSAVQQPLPPSPATLATARPAQTDTGVYDVLAAGPVSPRGVPAEGVSPARALQLAHAFQHGPESGRDRDEAIYWLKRYVLATAGAEHARIALTQLGSAYAAPAPGGVTRDFARARVAWELAGALGDTVAMCFLAALHEQGLGVPADRPAAENWYARALSGGASCARPDTPAAR